VALEVSALRRLNEKGVLQLEFTVANRSDLAVSLYNLSLANHSAIEGFNLVENDGLVKPGEAKTFWAWFALPPAEVQQMSVLIRDRSPILDVQLQ
jgi:hypothetical protein